MMIQSKVLAFLGLAAKAGKVASGEFSVENAVRQNKAKLVLVAEDASDNTKKLFADKCSFYQVPCIVFATKEELGNAIGKQFRASVAVTDTGFAKGLLSKLNTEEPSKIKLEPRVEE